MVKVMVYGVAIDKRSNTPVVLLKNEYNNSILPIWIGFSEALSISLAIHNIKPKRPLTHDLLINIMNGLDITLDKVVISELRDNIYYGKLYLKQDGSIIEVDARPSDCIALAVRNGCSIYVNDSIFSVADTFSLDEDEINSNFKSLLPENFGYFHL